MRYFNLLMKQLTNLIEKIVAPLKDVVVIANYERYP